MSPHIHEGQEEANRTLAESWDDTSPCDRATLEQRLKQTVLQVSLSLLEQLCRRLVISDCTTMVYGIVNDPLFALHQSRSMKNTGHEVKIIQVLFINMNNIVLLLSAEAF